MKVSIIKKSAIVSAFRIDAECYQEKYISAHKKLMLLKYTLLGNEISVFSKGIFDIKSECYTKSGIPFVRISDLKGFLIEQSNIIYIPETEHLKNYKTVLKRGDVILSKTAYPAASFMNLDECNTSQDTIALKLKSNSRIISEYLVVFLNSKYGFNQMLRWFTGNVQMHLNLIDSRNIIIPILAEIQEEIKSIFSIAIRLKIQSEKKLKQAQTFLLSELGLSNWQPKHQLTFVKNYSDTEQAERIDAEYFQPKYEEIEEAIKSYSGGYSLIKNEFKQNKKTFKTDDEKKYQYVEIGSVNVSNGEIIPSEVLGSKLPTNAKRVLNKGDIIVSKVRTYRGAITIVEENGYVGSGAFTVLQENGQLNKETLLAFLHSKSMLAWSLKPNTGTSYPVIVDDDIFNLPIPILPEEIQTTIQQKVEKSFILRKQSKYLLECAKKAVEMAIEQDEQTAINWLKKQIQDIGVMYAD